MAQIIVKHSYPKTWIDHDAQVERLIQRGLEVADKEDAKRILAYANYYRFTGYGLPFQHVDPTTNERVFNKGTSFTDVWALYQKDRELRDCISAALETVEISFRSSLAYCFAKVNGAFGHLNPANFISKFTAKGIDANGRPTRSRYEEWHDDLLKETQRSNELFVKHFSATYSEFPDLPIWTASEICSFGTLSKMFANMLRQDMREIAMNYHLQASISFLRLCPQRMRTPQPPLGQAPCHCAAIASRQVVGSGKEWQQEALLYRDDAQLDVGA